ncbi:hypothetical protein F2P81_021816 [Scophthalmus maximus]|uniref:Uncharacterized protein n=1 Tax=Scophthalmus maximus TaxID=52904 RepID=A0A6A4RXT2_SCOMX|nr:hypothetical protein F2P81_021816 [Scophthalmus maximus]
MRSDLTRVTNQLSVSFAQDGNGSVEQQVTMRLDPTMFSPSGRSYMKSIEEHVRVIHIQFSQRNKNFSSFEQPAARLPRSVQTSHSQLRCVSFLPYAVRR